MLKRLPWDSEFWRTEIYNADTIKDTPSPNNIPLIQCLIPCHDTEQIKLACAYGYEFIQGKVTLEKSVNNSTDMNTAGFRPLKIDDLDANKKSFYEMYGAYSRHLLFPVQKINEYYYQWIKNTINGSMDDECIGYYIDNDASGFISYKKRESSLVIGLVGVFPKFQRQGISQKLLNYAYNYAYANSCENILVATQDSNITAINAYIKHGYKINRIDFWYYKVNSN